MKGGGKKGKTKHVKVIRRQTFLLEGIFSQVHYKQAMLSHVLLTHKIILYQI